MRLVCVYNTKHPLATCHDVQTDNQGDLQHRECKFEFTIYPHEEDVAEEDENTKDGDPDCRVKGFSKVDYDSCGHNLSRSSNQIGIDLIPPVGK